MAQRKTNRKENTYIIDEKLHICKIATALSKSLNPGIKLWKTESFKDILLHDFEAIIDYDENLIELLKNNYLVFYDNSNDVRKMKTLNPMPTPFENVGYFWALNIHTKERIPLARLVWEFKSQRKIPYGHIADHGNDFHNLCIFSNITPMAQTENKNKLRYPKRIVEPYSVTMISHPEGLPIKLLRFIDNEKQKQELLIYDTTNGIDHILNDLNSFKKVAGKDANKFKEHFEDLKNKSENYIARSMQHIKMDMLERELFHISVNWKTIDKKVAKARIESTTAIAS